MGKVLWIDLTTGSIKDEILEEKFCRDFIGGYGFGLRVLYDRMKAGVEPLGPDNILGFGQVFNRTPMFSVQYTVIASLRIPAVGVMRTPGIFRPHLRFAALMQSILRQSLAVYLFTTR
jgi:hypothetical protein